jgi:hypothetical protein
MFEKKKVTKSAVKKAVRKNANVEGTPRKRRKKNIALEFETSSFTFSSGVTLYFHVYMEQEQPSEISEAA